MCYFVGESHWDQTASEINYDSVTVKGLEFGTLYEMRVVAVDGRFETPSEIEEIETGGLGMCNIFFSNYFNLFMEHLNQLFKMFLRLM